MPRFRATSVIECPSSTTKRTASSLNSRLWIRRGFLSTTSAPGEPERNDD